MGYEKAIQRTQHILGTTQQHEPKIGMPTGSSRSEKFTKGDSHRVPWSRRTDGPGHGDSERIGFKEKKPEHAGVERTFRFDHFARGRKDQANGGYAKRSAHELRGGGEAYEC